MESAALVGQDNLGTGQHLRQLRQHFHEGGTFAYRQKCKGRRPACSGGLVPAMETLQKPAEEK